MKYKLVLFDLDGTLLDTSPGIIHCYNTTAKHFGKPERPADSFRGIIGGTLPDNFIRNFGFTEEDVRSAVEFYREEYAQRGIHMAAHYDGIKELLAQLKQEGVKTGVATLKREDFAESMMEEFGLAEYLDVIRGMDREDTRTKSGIINECMAFFGAAPQETVIIGDSRSDANGAEQSGIDFIGVTYGWGFATKDDIRSGYYTNCSDNAEEITAALTEGKE